MDSHNTDTQDGSIEEVSSVALQMHEGWIEGDFSHIEKLKEIPTPKNVVTSSVEASSENDDDDDDGVIVNRVKANVGMAETKMNECTPPQLDGWIMIAPKKKREARFHNLMPKSAGAEDGWTVVAPVRNKDTRKQH